MEICETTLQDLYPSKEDPNIVIDDDELRRGSGQPESDMKIMVAEQAEQKQKQKQKRTDETLERQHRQI